MPCLEFVESHPLGGAWPGMGHDSHHSSVIPEGSGLVARGDSHGSSSWGASGHDRTRPAVWTGSIPSGVPGNRHGTPAERRCRTSPSPDWVHPDHRVARHPLMRAPRGLSETLADYARTRVTQATLRRRSGATCRWSVNPLSARLGRRTTERNVRHPWALLLFLWVRFGGAAQGVGPLLPGQGRLWRRCARALRAPLDLRA